MPEDKPPTGMLKDLIQSGLAGEEGSPLLFVEDLPEDDDA